MEVSRAPLGHTDNEKLESLTCPLRTSTVVVASGAYYRRPNIDRLAEFEGRGVWYWASPVEARLCAGEEVILVGGGNSAGQAAVFLSAHARKVKMMVRGPGQLMLQVEDIEATKAALLAKGVTPNVDITDVGVLGIKVMFVNDPEGNPIEIVEVTDPA